MDLDNWYEDYRKDQKLFSNKIILDDKGLKKEYNSNGRSKIGSKTNNPKPIELFRGYEYQPFFDDDGWDYFEGYYKEWRREICLDDKIITEFQMWDFCRNYFLLDQRKTVSTDELLDSRGQMKFEMLKIMRDEFFKSWKEEYFDKGNKVWKDFDINRIYFQTRSLMKGRSDFPIPNYVWLMDDRPFTYSYRLTRDYMKWKGTKRVTKLVFDNVTKWENGKLFKENEPQGELLNKPLWVNWNVVGKDLSMMKTKLKKEGRGGLEWLRDEVGSYIKERKSFYEQFGKDSKYFISDEVITKFDKLKK